MIVAYLFIIIAVSCIDIGLFVPFVDTTLRCHIITGYYRACTYNTILNGVEMLTRYRLRVRRITERRAESPIDLRSSRRGNEKCRDLWDPNFKRGQEHKYRR